MEFLIRKLTIIGKYYEIFLIFLSFFVRPSITKSVQQRKIHNSFINKNIFLKRRLFTTSSLFLSKHSWRFLLFLILWYQIFPKISKISSNFVQWKDPSILPLFTRRDLELVNLFVGTKNFSYHICYET